MQLFHYLQVVEEWFIQEILGLQTELGKVPTGEYAYLNEEFLLKTKKHLNQIGHKTAKFFLESLEKVEYDDESKHHYDLGI